MKGKWLLVLLLSFLILGQLINALVFQKDYYANCSKSGAIVTQILRRRLVRRSFWRLDGICYVVGTWDPFAVAISRGANEICQKPIESLIKEGYICVKSPLEGRPTGLDSLISVLRFDPESPIR